MYNPSLKHKGELEMTPIFFLVGMLAMSLVLRANAQVEVKQSVTTNDNGQKTSINTDSKAPANICQGLPNACDLSSELKLPQGETIKVTEQPGAVVFAYCKGKQCHTYVPDDHGTIQKVSKK
jgi:hypothetical protein